MPLPRRIAYFNRRVTNRITRHVVGWMPGFAIVIHVGRRSGRTYETPVNVFRDGSRYVFALTYGPESDWVRNVLAAGGCRIKTRRRTIELRDPQRFADPSRPSYRHLPGGFWGSSTSTSSLLFLRRPRANAR
jgi:deazaflavin-dependent oxidoreductase (nitroreductase family)